MTHVVPPLTYQNEPGPDPEEGSRTRGVFRVQLWDYGEFPPPTGT